MKTSVKAIRFLFFTVSALLFFAGCKDNHEAISVTDNLNAKIKIADLATDKGAYKIEEDVKLSFSFVNDEISDITIDNVVVQIRDISKKNSPVVYEKKVASTININAGNRHVVGQNDFWKIPTGAAATAYGIYLQYEVNKTPVPLAYQSFFRVVRDADFTTYQIEHTTYKGLDVYALHGGMSAECVVEKAVESLKPGIAHSWFVSAPGSGPEHVLATPQFLEKSVKETVNFYNQSLGESTSFETVIIGPGLEAFPYLSHAMKAPVLPLQFLASSNTVKEVQSILDCSNRNGYASYATLGHDASVPFAVSWVKLLEMPDEYLTFLKQHQVKNLLFVGYTGADGENTAKKVINNVTVPGYQPGSLFILYPGGGSQYDMGELKSKIVDFENTNQQNEFVRIADWESGIISDQINNFTKAGKEKAGIINTRFITAKEMISLWDLATYVSAAFFHKNNKVFTANNEPAVKGISINPYFTANAFYECYQKYLPLIYWQLNPADSTISRVKNTVSKALSVYFPEIKITTLSCWVNSSNNFGGSQSASQLKASIQLNGINKIIENDYTQDDIWRPSDGMKAPVEIRADDMLLKQASSLPLKNWNDKLKALSMEDIDSIGKKFPDIIVN